MDAAVAVARPAAPPTQVPRFLTINQQAAKESEAMALARTKFIHDESNKSMHDHEQIIDLFLELLDCEATAPLAGLTLRDAIQESGHSWDGISALSDLILGRARKRAAEAWAAKLAAEAPSCRECSYSKEDRDPYGTGDSPTAYECKVFVCPWGK